MRMRTIRQYIISLAGIVCVTSTLVFLMGPQSNEDYDSHAPAYDERPGPVSKKGTPEISESDTSLVNKLLEDVAEQSRALKEYVELVKHLNDEVVSTKSALKSQNERKKPGIQEDVLGEEVAEGDGVIRAASSATPGTNKKGDLKKDISSSPNDIETLIKQNYLGCYMDSFGQRDMPVYLPSFTQHPAKCMTACYARGHKYAGLQDGGECWCGPDAPRQKKLDDTQCGKVCSGDQTKKCGGELKNSVYKAVDIGLKDDNLFIKRPFVLANAGSSVTCQGNNKDTRVCKFRNLYYDTSTSLSRNRIFIFYRGPGTIIVNLEEVKNAKSGEFVEGIMELTSITGIYGMDIRVIDLPSSLESVEHPQDLPYLRYKDVRVVPGSSSLFARFLPFNIMHHLHDDLMNLFMTLVEYSSPHYPTQEISSGKKDGLLPPALFDTQTRLVVMDAHGAGGYSTLLQYLSDVPITHISELVSVADNDAKESSLLQGPTSTSKAPRSAVLESGSGNLIQFETAVTGITRHCNWYQYGFNIPQGPLEDKEVDGHNVRLFSNYILSRLPPLTTLPASTPLMVDRAEVPKRNVDLRVTDPDERYIVIFSRTLNRKILNEPELVEALELAYPKLKVVILRLEETPLPVLMRVCEKASIGIGMHGSILILALFMPKGSLVVEMYPYAVPSDNYTPYRTLAGLKNMDMKYAAWENNHKENTIEYPNRARLQGGLSHLAEDEKEKVMNARWVPKHKCCEDPNWLFRIYQDTKVHVGEVLDLIRKKGPW